jgi:hypothetical protein
MAQYPGSVASAEGDGGNGSRRQPGLLRGSGTALAAEH